MFKDKEIHAAIEEETKGTNGHSPLKFLVMPNDQPEQIRRAIADAKEGFRDEDRTR